MTALRRWSSTTTTAGGRGTSNFQAMMNVIVACGTCVLASQVLRYKSEKSMLELERDAATAELEALRRRVQDVAPVAAALDVDASRLQAMLSAHLRSGGTFADQGDDAPKMI